MLKILYYLKTKLIKYVNDYKILEDTVRIFEIIIIGSSIFITYSQLTDIIPGTNFSLFWITLLLVIIGIIYSLLVLREFFKKQLQLNRLVILIYIIIFCFGLFAGIIVFKNNQPLALIPKFQKGTIGLRTYGCEINFKSIEISFLDSNNLWQKIPDFITNDSTNWIRDSFKKYGKMKSNCNFSLTKDTISITLEKYGAIFPTQTKDKLSVKLKNSGVIFSIRNLSVQKYFKGAQYFRVSTVISVVSDLELFSDAQICMNVPINGTEENTELYLGFSLPIKNINNAKFWIPATNWKFGNVYRDPISKLNDNGINENLRLVHDYNFIAVSFLNSVRLLINRGDNTSIICESEFRINYILETQK